MTPFDVTPSAPSVAGSPPGSVWDRSSPVGRLLGAVDDAGDALFTPVRGRTFADDTAALISNLADYGVVWVALAGLKARRGGRARRRAVVALAGAGIASYAVNRAAKALAGRERPAEVADRGAPASGPPSSGGAVVGVLPVRRPSSSSFPSGHVLAAFCTALVLPASRGGRSTALAFASAVAASRVHLRAHHASDVLAGAVVGTATGLVVRPLVDALARTGRPAPG